VAIQRVHPSSLQPRKDFPAEALQELADSIREKGVLQPLIARPRGGDFELIAGERRWRAAQLLGLTEVPVVARGASDNEVLEMMLVENLQRENLNPIEEAQGYDQLITQFQLRQEDVAVKVGKNRATVANALRLLKLAPEVQDWVRRGQLSAGHAKVILGLERLEEQRLAAEKVINEGLSVRATEEFVTRWQKHGAPRAGGKSGRQAEATFRDAHVVDLENRLRQRFGTKVQLRYRKGKGAVTVHFFNDADLTRILEIFSVKID
jgi:ParB family chromosome partitioning protein